jgi:DNA-binding IclR family transcriptional regulator
MSERRRQRYLEAEVPNADERARISAELARVREEGVAVNNGETLPDVSAVAAAILVGGKPLASIAIAGPTSRMTAKLEPGAVAVRRAVEAVSARL